MSVASKLPLAGRLTFFYGWRIIALGFLLNLMTAGLSSSAFSVFVSPMGNDLGWSRSAIVLATTIGTLAAAVSGHFLGQALDKRQGARILTTGGLIIIGVSTILIGRIQETWHLYGLFLVGGAVGLSAYPGLITPTIVSKWFVRRRGMAISFASMGLPSSGFILSPYANFLINEVGWRDAWTYLGITALALTVPWTALFMRRRPEDIGLRPDGDDPADRARAGEMMPVVPDEHSWTIRQAIDTRAFWLILISSSLGMFCFIGVLINFFASVTDPGVGFTRDQATLAFSTFSILSLLGKLPWAYLADRMDIRVSTAFTYAGPAIAMAVLIYADSIWMLILWGAIYGIGASGISLLPSLAWGSYFGRTFLGSIRGITSPVAFFGQAVGPLFAALLYDELGSYQVPYAVFIALFMLSAVLMLFARKPVPPAEVPIPESQRLFPVIEKQDMAPRPSIVGRSK